MCGSLNILPLPKWKWLAWKYYAASAVNIRRSSLNNITLAEQIKDRECRANQRQRTHSKSVLQQSKSKTENAQQKCTLAEQIKDRECTAKVYSGRANQRQRMHSKSVLWQSKSKTENAQQNCKHAGKYHNKILLHQKVPKSNVHCARIKAQARWLAYLHFVSPYFAKQSKIFWNRSIFA